MKEIYPVGYKESFYYRYNPVIRWAIKPALKITKAHDHPIRGGTAAGVASVVAHYCLLEVITQATDYFFGTNLRDPETKMALTSLPWYAHLVLTSNFLSNFIVGSVRYKEKEEIGGDDSLTSRVVNENG